MKTISSNIYQAFGLVVVASVALLSQVQAVVPPPDGGYPNFTTAEGDNALKALTTGVGNTAVGAFSLFDVSTGSFNTAVGAGSLDLNQADFNTATGAAALLFNSAGTANTATGTAALEFNQTGNSNTATGAFALFSNTTGPVNTAYGASALFSNTTGGQNTAVGWDALFVSTTGSDNTAVGDNAMGNSTTGNDNTAVGHAALGNNPPGDFNTAVGSVALLNATGTGNTGIGHLALAFTTGDGSIGLGENAGHDVTGASGVICIGSPGGNVTNSCFIGHIRGAITAHADAIPVLIDSAGQLGTVSSSQRFKHDIKEMDKTSEGILALKPVTFHYKSDKTNTPQFGLIAEDVAKVNPDLVVHDENGEIYTVRYDAVNAMLLNEFLKEHRAFLEEQDKVDKLEKQVVALTTGLQKVSAQLELNKTAPQTALNNR